VSYGKGSVPDGYVVRTFRVKVMATPAQTRRAKDLLVSGGDVWAWCIDRFHARIRDGLPNANSLTELWPDQRQHGPFRELTAHCAQDVTKAWSAAFFEVMKRRKKRERARLPLRKHWVVPVTWRKGEFELVAAKQGHRPRAVLKTARGLPNLLISLSHDHPYDPELARAVRLSEEAGALYLDITAWVAVAEAKVVPEKLAGVDPGIVHPLAIATGDQALLISGRAVRVEEFLHLEDQKARQKKMATKTGPRRAKAGQARRSGSRRWKALARSQRRAEAKDRRVVKLANNRAARLAAQFMVANQVSLAVIGNPTGIEKKPSGRQQNRRTGRWARAHQRDALCYRLEEVSIAAALTEERGTSSTCPSCATKATKKGRRLVCSNFACKKAHHRDIAGAQNMVTKLGHAPSEIARTEHRRVGSPARRDRRRHHYDADRGLARTRAAALAVQGAESLVAPRQRRARLVTTTFARGY
jgi:transposase